MKIIIKNMFHKITASENNHDINNFQNLKKVQ